MQPDPIGAEDDLNLYAYLENEPISQIDWSGTSCTKVGETEYACKVDYKPGNLTSQQEKAIADFEERYTAAVNNLMSHPDRMAEVDMPNGPDFKVSAGEVGERLIRSQVTAAINTAHPNARAESPDRNSITLYKQVFTQGKMSTYDFAAAQVTTLVHEGIHWTGWGPLPIKNEQGLTRSTTGELSKYNPYALSTKKLRQEHKQPFNDAAKELVSR